MGFRRKENSKPVYKTISFETHTQSVDVVFRPSHRAKSFRLTHAKKGLHFILTYPSYVPEVDAFEFLGEQKKWIDETLKELPQKVQIKFDQPFSFFGNYWVLVRDPLRRRGVYPADGKLFLNPSYLDIEKVLVSFLKQEALSFFEETSKEYAEKLGVEFSKVAVRDNSTRWGSCSSEQNLSYSWRLGFAPVHVARYVVAHEIAHLKYMDHSPLFWETVGQMDPKYKRNKSWLKKEGHSLMMTSFDLL